MGKMNELDGEFKERESLIHLKLQQWIFLVPRKSLQAAEFTLRNESAALIKFDLSSMQSVLPFAN
jgi:hypothetical protein